MLDTLARAPIWAGRRRFRPWNGPCVGYFLNVHEGPYGITPHLPPEPATRWSWAWDANEPGIYRPGRWGRAHRKTWCSTCPRREGTERVRRVSAVRDVDVVAVDTRVIDPGTACAMTRSMDQFLSAEVRRRVGPHVRAPPAEWLQLRTAAIDDVANQDGGRGLRMGRLRTAACIVTIAVPPWTASPTGKVDTKFESQSCGDEFHPQHHPTEDLIRGTYEPRQWIAARALRRACQCARRPRTKFAHRFPPEPNGYLHIDTPSRICLNSAWRATSAAVPQHAVRTTPTGEGGPGVRRFDLETVPLDWLRLEHADVRRRIESVSRQRLLRADVSVADTDRNRMRLRRRTKALTDIRPYWHFDRSRHRFTLS